MSSYQDNAGRYLSLGKEKLKQALNATKQSSYYKRVADKINGTGTSRSVEAAEEASVPDDAQILLYIDYSRQTADGEYTTNVAGSIFAPGKMTARNRMMMSLARRFSKTSDSETVSSGTTDQFEEQLADAVRNPQTRQASFEDDTTSVLSTTDDTVADRMSGVIAATIARTPLNVQIGAADRISRHELVSYDMYSDQYGLFSMAVRTPYAPESIIVTSLKNRSVCQVLPVSPIPLTGLSVISDVDDTVRRTGVLEEKMDLFRNLFSKPFADCQIAGVSEWYRALHARFGCPIHYVSNSPWQVYNIVEGFLAYEQLPVASIHLKQYFGNIFSSVTMPASERKRSSLYQIMHDFPGRKFVLFGDSGEQDLEAYLALAPLFADQILAIYIRAVPNSFSSIGKDKENMRTLQTRLDGRTEKEQQEQSPPPTPSPRAQSVTGTESTSFSRSEISVARPSSIRKLPPMVPFKPAKLQGKPVTPPVPEERAQTTPELSEVKAPPLPQRPPTQHNHLAWLNSSPLQENVPGNRRFRYASTSSLRISATEGPAEIVDAKMQTWMARIDVAVQQLPAKIPVKFWWNTAEVQEDCMRIIEANR